VPLAWKVDNPNPVLMRWHSVRDECFWELNVSGADAHHGLTQDVGAVNDVPGGRECNGIYPV